MLDPSSSPSANSDLDNLLWVPVTREIRHIPCDCAAKPLYCRGCHNVLTLSAGQFSLNLWTPWNKYAF
jgi:hypothetical protein